MQTFILLTTMFFILLLAVLVHELGHYLTLWYYLKHRPLVQIKGGAIRIGLLSDYADLNPSQRYLIYAVGVCAGAFVIGMYGFYWDLAAFALLLPYMWASAKDLRNMYRCYRAI